MTKYEAAILGTLHAKGVGATEIARTLGISVNTVRSHLRRHPAEGAAQSRCRQCGAPVAQAPGRKAKLFCSDRCRNAWWNSHPEQVRRKAYYHLTCAYCKKEFESYGNPRQKYCSRKCYAHARAAHPVPDRVGAGGGAS